MLHNRQFINGNDNNDSGRKVRVGIDKDNAVFVMSKSSCSYSGDISITSKSSCSCSVNSISKQDPNNAYYEANSLGMLSGKTSNRVE